MPRAPRVPTEPPVNEQLVESSNGGTLVSVVPGPKGQAAINHYFDSYRSVTVLAIAPTSLINFGEAVNFPLIFGPCWPCSA